MKKLLPLMLVIVAVSLCTQAAYGQMAQMSGKAGEMKTETAKPEQKSLYERLGGYDAIAAVSDDFIGRLGKSKLLGRFVVGLSEDSKKKLRQHFVDFICNATGGPCLYIGRDMKTTHAGLGIDEKDWEEGVKLLGETLDHFKVPAKEKGELVGAVAALKKDIVEKK
ncbi:MAG TPA: group 1 truncated hemoglobin [Pyrinomonadaceae bacterium]|jgi:hemoglobin|nr:group 1 truncated hemoglobin [Pyrinomonadaceae bacterium]